MEKNMLKGLFTSYTSMVNEQHRLDVIANNLANVNTNGYKKEGATSQAFKDVFGVKIKDASEAANLPKKLGIMNMGVKIGENYTDYSEGPVKHTDNPFDIAIDGKGFFAVEFTNKAGETSIKYTRDGNFTMNAEGYLTTQDGDYLLNTRNARIRLNPNLSAEINALGEIYQDGNLVATIGVKDFDDYNYLEHYGKNYFQPVQDAQARPATDYKLDVGYLETSNVSVVDEMVNMIAVQRHYEANQKVITTYDSSLEIAVNQLGKVQ